MKTLSLFHKMESSYDNFTFQLYKRYSIDAAFNCEEVCGCALLVPKQGTNKKSML